LGEKPSPLGEDFGSIFCATRILGIEDSRVREYIRFPLITGPLESLNPQAIPLYGMIVDDNKVGSYSGFKLSRKNCFIGVTGIE
jgi:hypothetical protein